MFSRLFPKDMSILHRAKLKEYAYLISWIISIASQQCLLHFIVPILENVFIYGCFGDRWCLKILVCIKLIAFWAFQTFINPVMMPLITQTSFQGMYLLSFASQNVWRLMLFSNCKEPILSTTCLKLTQEKVKSQNVRMTALSVVVERFSVLRIKSNQFKDVESKKSLKLHLLLFIVISQQSEVLAGWDQCSVGQ